ncbi:MAG: efflux RND transporter permease subunit [bacterium]
MSDDHQLSPAFGAGEHRNDVIGLFAQHRVAANLLMLVMLLSGILALAQLNTQFFPPFEVERVTVRVVWTGATSEDVERSLTTPLEQVLRSVDDLKNMTSTSAQGVSVVGLEFPEGTDMSAATARVEELVNGIRNLPIEAEEPQISKAIAYEPIARLLVYGPEDIRELRWLARRFERELLARGIAKVNLTGLPQEEIAIQVPMVKLETLDMTLEQVANRVSSGSVDAPAGTIGRDDVGRQLRSINQQRDVPGYEQLPVAVSEDGQLIRVADIADVERRARPGEVEVTYQGKPAVKLQLMRAISGDSLKSAQIMEDWLADTRPTLPEGVEIVVYDEGWQLIKDRISLLVKNGLGGLILVVAILFWFLNARVAFWVTVGIPTSFMATLAIVYLVGGSINMISLFALIMALGIIVDDAIVVGEDALSHYQTGENPLQAAEGGARRMLAPVMSSSMTTVAAFIPLMMVSGIIGSILGDIPFVVICVIAASLVEVFLVLPGHLRHSFLKSHHKPPSKQRERWEAWFDHFRDVRFRRVVTFAVNRPGVTIASAVAALILCIGLIGSGRLGFTFFPNIEGNIIHASANFVSGTPPDRVETFIREAENALYETEQEFGAELIKIAEVSVGQGVSADPRDSKRGEQFASITVELVPSDRRTVRNEQFLKAWETRLQRPPGLESLTMTSRRGGPPGRDIEIRLTGGTTDSIKQASLELMNALSGVPGVSAIEDDMPYGQQQIVYELTPVARSLGLTEAEVGRQLRASLDGYLAQIFNEAADEIEVRVMLPDQERYRLATLEHMLLSLPNGNTIPLTTALNLKENRGFEVLRHAAGQLATTVYADVDRSQNNENDVRAQLSTSTLVELSSKYGVDWEFTGRAEDQKDTLSDMRRGGIFALAMIYVVLAWVFGSYGWPLVVMLVIPFGIVGAIFGHWLMGIELTILSMFGLFGLSGIVVNDSIILVVFYKQLREKGMKCIEAIVEAACQRLRAVLLTSLTTIAGLTPLLFETSLQAQFLIPMAVSISFGLAFATLLVLLLVPALLGIHERLAGRWGFKRFEEQEATA